MSAAHIERATTRAHGDNGATQGALLHPDLERDLQTVAAMVQGAMGDALRALVLLGGYARGEGGVLRHQGRVRAHNDFDLVALVNGPARRWRAPLRALGARAGARVGVEVDLWPLEAEALQHPPRTLLWLDAALGGARVLAGDASALAGLASLRARDVPLDEVGRLLANRAVGLALSRLGAAWGAPIVRARHVHKSVLACGDAVLFAADQYVATARGRLEALRALEASPAVGASLVRAYDDALRFRARPDLWAPLEGRPLDAWSTALVPQIASWHLSFEQYRIGTPADPIGYARFEGALYPGASETRGPRAALAGAASVLKSYAREAPSALAPLMHPRERLARVAVLAAYAPPSRLRAELDRWLPAWAHESDEARARAIARLAHEGG